LAQEPQITVSIQIHNFAGTFPMTNLQSKSLRRSLLTVGALLVVLAVLTGCSSVSLPPLTAPTVAEDTAAPTAEAEAEPAATADESAADDESAPTTPDVATGVHKGVPVGFTADGFPFRGQPRCARSLSVEFSDFECPFCVRHFVQTEPALLDAYLSTGNRAHRSSATSPLSRFIRMHRPHMLPRFASPNKVQS
jgi:hypothetical protein